MFLHVSAYYCGALLCLVDAAARWNGTNGLWPPFQACEEYWGGQSAYWVKRHRLLVNDYKFDASLKTEVDFFCANAMQQCPVWDLDALFSRARYIRASDKYTRWQLVGMTYEGI